MKTETFSPAQKVILLMAGAATLIWIASFGGCGSGANPDFFGKEPASEKISLDQTWAAELSGIGHRVKGKAVVREVRGNALILSGGSVQNAKVGDTLVSGDTAQTASKSSMLLELDSGGSLRLDEKTSLRLAKLSRENIGIEVHTQTLLELHEGSIQTGRRKLSAASTWLVWTPNGVFGPAQAISAEGLVEK